MERKKTLLTLAVLLAAGAAYWLSDSADGDPAPQWGGAVEADTALSAPADEQVQRSQGAQRQGAEEASFHAGDPGLRELTVIVLDAQSREPIPGVVVRVIPDLSESEQRLGREAVNAQIKSSVSNAEGRGVVQVPSRPAQVLADFQTWSGRAAIGADDTEVELLVQPQIYLDVRCVDASGRPLPDLSVAKISAAGQSGGISNASGVCRLRIELDDSGPWQIRPSNWVGPPDGFPVVERSHFVDAVHRVDLVVPLHGSVRVRMKGIESDDEIKWLVLTLHVAGRPDLRTSKRFFARERTAREWTVAPVAIGQQLELSYMGWARGEPQRKSFSGPRAPGEVVEIDLDLPREPIVEAEPASDPRITVVVHGADGELVRSEAVRVEARFKSNNGNRGRYLDGETDQEGRLDVGLASRHRRLWAQTLTAVAVSWQPSSGPGQVAVLEIGKTVPDGVDLGEVWLKPVPRVLSGQVLDAQNRPVVDAAVVALGEHADHARTLPVLTDADGRFAIEGPVGTSLGVVRPLRARATKDGFAPNVSEAVPQGSTVNLLLLRSGSVTVELEEFDGLPERLGLLFALEHDRLGRVAEQPLGIGQRSQFRWDEVPEGSVTLEVRADRRDRPLLVVEGIEVPAGGSAADSRLAPLRLRDLLRTVSIRLRLPKAGTFDQLMVWRVRAEGGGGGFPPDMAGRATVLLPPPGQSIDLIVTGPGIRPVWIRDVQRDQDIQLEPAQTVKVRVTGLPEGKPPSGFRPMRRSDPFDSVFPNGSSLRLDAEGVAEMPLLPAGEYTFEVSRTKLRGALRVPEVYEGEILELQLESR